MTAPIPISSPDNGPGSGGANPAGSPTPAPACSSSYQKAYGRINGVVVLGEGLADRQFRLLADAIPEDRHELLRLAAMEGRHANAFLGCAHQLGLQPDRDLARRLFAPLHALFLGCHRRGDRAGCLVIQGLVVECFAVAAYSAFLPVADDDSRAITVRVLADESEHLGYAERWLQQRFSRVEESVQAACRLALPITLTMLIRLTDDLRTIGIDPNELLAGFVERFQQALETIGFDTREARRLLVAATSTLVTA